MATFNPFGFRWSYSTSAASQASPTLVEFPWNPLFSGWSGDLAIQYLPGAGSATALSSTDGYVYPGYLESSVEGGSDIFNYPPIIGVIAGFRYTPASDAILSNNSWSSFQAGTQVVGKVTVIVNTDIQGRYAVQYKGGSLKGVTQNYLFGMAEIWSDTRTVQTVGPNTFTFAVGTPNTSAGSATGNLPGTSTIYIQDLQTQSGGVTSLKLARTTTFPVFLQTPEYSATNDWYDAASPNAAQNENTIMTVLLNNNYTTTNWEPILTQVPATV
jgi:hypothetical protein